MIFIYLTKGYRVAVSPVDYASLNSYRWYASIESRGTKVYAVRWQRGIKIRMHRFLLGLGPDPERKGLVVNHINDDSLDNRRENLELITQAENILRVPGWRKKGLCLKDRKLCTTIWQQS